MQPHVSYSYKIRFPAQQGKPTGNNLFAQYSIPRNLMLAPQATITRQYSTRRLLSRQNKKPTTKFCPKPD